ncbi:hypothetical protein GMORB2_6722 [Geosmithia morbida]|uniref:Uncharacterized protein n=1 Tax=Geosmithia morbida TaxID=1094350 RepID=A0A9P4YWN8_9HYPO|nr:uncharacterized protein GMORB2_6722 [Geosmithia morbida]KAF4123172.1 hypothetical protein GMORB2_6722 [Geosmithia morbida]
MSQLTATLPQRFVLAEIIKSSRLDVETLAMFVRDNRIEPDWWNMQLPPRRNMNQCVEAADRMGIASSLKRRSSNDYTEHSSKRTATASRPGYPPPVPVQPNYPYTHQPPAPPHGAVLPHPGMSDYRQRHPAMPVADSHPSSSILAIVAYIRCTSFLQQRPRAPGSQAEHTPGPAQPGCDGRETHHPTGSLRLSKGDAE